jgi:HPt (histidine-containing phosphotransfer) domain-containing protein
MVALHYEASKLLDGEILSELGSLSAPEDERDGAGGLLGTLVSIFEQTADETYGRICSSAASAELTAFGEGVHKLKGRSGSIGAAALYDCCKAIDQLYKTNQLPADELPRFADAIGRELVRAKVALEDYVRRQ